MRYERALECAILERRYKRFLADVVTPDGSAQTAHCPNTRFMLGCSDPGMTVWRTIANHPKRRYAKTLEQVDVAGVRAGVHTGRPDKRVAEAIENGLIETLAGYHTLSREVIAIDTALVPRRA